MHEFNVVTLENTKLRDDVRRSLEFWRQEAQDGRVKQGAARTQDFRRWSYVLNLIEPTPHSAVDLVDVGVGLGQFATIAASTKKFDRVRGLDYTRYQEMDASAFDFVQHDITKQPPTTLHADVVTCLECIEHIKSPGFEKAVENLKAMARKRLIVSVPYAEKEPLPRFHHQRFDTRRLRQLFPRAEITLLANGPEISWALVDTKIDPDPYWAVRDFPQA